MPIKASEKKKRHRSDGMENAGHKGQQTGSQQGRTSRSALIVSGQVV
jgi:hypothetical protein